MSHNPSKKNIEEFDEIKINIENLQNDWLETVENFAGAKDRMMNEDLFATIDYLATCDLINKTIYLDLKEINSQLNHLDKLKKNHPPEEKLDHINKLASIAQKLKTRMKEKMAKISDEYPILSESTLRRAQDLISNFSESMEREKITPNLKTDINQNLEKELFLGELKDILEAYRLERESFISEVEMNSLRKLPEERIPEDLGEENPEIDSILLQLDTAISSCDRALIIKEITD